MAETEALVLLKKKLGSLPIMDMAGGLVRTLDLVSLAISQAAAYIGARAPRTSVQYLDGFRKSWREKSRSWSMMPGTCGGTEPRQTRCLRRGGSRLTISGRSDLPRTRRRRATEAPVRATMANSQGLTTDPITTQTQIPRLQQLLYEILKHITIR